MLKSQKIANDTRKISVQRLFHWHIIKMFYNNNLYFFEMNHINYKQYLPFNASSHSLEEILKWCGEAKLSIEKRFSENADITKIAKYNG